MLRMPTCCGTDAALEQVMLLHYYLLFDALMNKCHICNSISVDAINAMLMMLLAVAYTCHLSFARDSCFEYMEAIVILRFCDGSYGGIMCYGDMFGRFEDGGWGCG